MGGLCGFKYFKLLKREVWVVWGGMGSLGFEDQNVPSKLRTVIQNEVTSRPRLPNKNYGTLRIPSL